MRTYLKQKQSLPLEAKIRMSLNRIKAFYDALDGDVYISFSGGKDSTVLLDLVRMVDPNVVAVFVDTGLEFPQIKKFCRATENCEIIKPKMSFTKVLDKYGHPVVSKQVSMGIGRYLNTKSQVQKDLRMHGGVNPTSGKPQQKSIPDKWKFLVHAPFKISEKCCDVMKKSPVEAYRKRTGLSPFIGTMAGDSNNRLQAWSKTGCNSFKEGKEKSSPLSFWLESDIWEYLHSKEVPYASVYDMGYHNTGCVFCMFGMDQEKEDRFELLQKTHPKLHNYCMDKLGLRDIIRYVKNGGVDQTSFLDNYYDEKEGE